MLSCTGLLSALSYGCCQLPLFHRYIQFMFSSLEDKSSEIIITLNREKLLLQKPQRLHDVYRSTNVGWYLFIILQYSVKQNIRKYRVRVDVYSSIAHGR